MPFHFLPGEFPFSFGFARALTGFRISQFSQPTLDFLWFVGSLGHFSGSCLVSSQVVPRKISQKPPGSTQEAHRKPSESPQEAPRKPPEIQQEALRKPPGSTQKAPRKPTGSPQKKPPESPQEAPRKPELPFHFLPGVFWSYPYPWLLNYFMVTLTLLVRF